MISLVTKVIVEPYPGYWRRIPSLAAITGRPVSWAIRSATLSTPVFQIVIPKWVRMVVEGDISLSSAMTSGTAR